MAEDRFRVATFNVRHAEGRDRRVDLERIAGVIQTLDAGLIALQELDVDLPRSGRIDQPAELGRLLDMRICFFPTLKFDGGSYGIALAGTGELVCRSEPLPRVGDEEPRIAIVGEWNDVRVVTTHLSRDRRARTLQTTRLAEIGAGLDAPVLVLGDMNQAASALGPLTAAGFQPAAAPNGWFRSQIDHVILGPGLAPLHARFEPTDASDHYPLVVEIERV